MLAHKPSRRTKRSHKVTQEQQLLARKSSNPAVQPSLLQWAIENSRTADPGVILQLQQQYGNRAVIVLHEGFSFLKSAKAPINEGAPTPQYHSLGYSYYKRGHSCLYQVAESFSR